MNFNYMEEANLFNNTKFGKIISFEDKDLLFRYHMGNFQKKLRNMFKYENLPETINFRNLELLTQKGYSIIVKYEDNIYSFYGGLGGKPDFNYMPTLATIAVPAIPELPNKWRINWGYEFITEETKDLPECVVIPNDSLFMGVIPTNSYYASQLVENDLTMNCNLINFRLMNLLVARDNDSYNSLMGVIDKLKNGEISAAIDDMLLTECIKSLPFTNNSGNNIVQLLEQRQYIKGSWWNECGVQSNYNMKRETITSSENILNVDSLLPVSDDMLEMRQKGWELANKVLGTKVKVDFDSAWIKLKKELTTKEEILEKEAQSMDKEFQNSENNKGGDDNEDTDVKPNEDN